MAEDVYIGLMSGTSADGVDAVAVSFTDHGLTAHRLTHTPFPDPLRATVQRLMHVSDDELDLANRTAVELSEFYAKAVDRLLTEAEMDRRTITAIGCHGQTVRHDPNGEYPFTLQLVNGAVLAELTGIRVVCDFRSADIAAGGQGAPLAPAFHAAMMRSANTPTVVVNLGGIANITVLDTDPATPVLGFDTGPANTLMDAWVHRCRGKLFDKDGDWARTGIVNQDLLDTFLEDDYFNLAPPKSTGRDYFNIDWVSGYLDDFAPIKPQDVQATLAHLTGKSVTYAINAYAASSGALLVCGGGSRNPMLMELLAAENPERLVTDTSHVGIEPEQVEALAFAWLARQRILECPGNLPSVTGASGPRLLGAVYLPAKKVGKH